MIIDFGYAVKGALNGVLFNVPNLAEAGVRMFSAHENYLDALTDVTASNQAKGGLSYYGGEALGTAALFAIPPLLNIREAALFKKKGVYREAQFNLPERPVTAAESAAMVAKEDKMWARIDLNRDLDALFKALHFRTGNLLMDIGAAILPNVRQSGQGRSQA